MTEEERAEFIRHRLYEAGVVNAVVMFEAPDDNGDLCHNMALLCSPMAGMGLTRWANAYLEELVTEEIEVSVYNWDGDDD